MSDILACLASGVTEEEILADFPDLRRDDIRASLAFAADRERRLATGRSPLRLLFDQNLSHELPGKLEEHFPGSRHVEDPDVGLKDACDERIWHYARREDLAIVSTNACDFLELSCKFGHPPKFIWIPNQLEKKAREHIFSERKEDLLAFHKNEQQGLLYLAPAGYGCASGLPDVGAVPR